MNTVITIDVEKDPWTDLERLKAVRGDIERVGRLPRGMQSGKSSVAVMIRTDDGRHVIGEISLEHFKLAAAAFEGAEQRDRGTSESHS